MLSGLMYDLRDHAGDPASPFHQRALDLARLRNLNPDNFGRNARLFMVAAAFLIIGGMGGLVLWR